MSRFASGKNAWFVCDISGARYRRKDMRLNWKNQLVGMDYYEPKHPQLAPNRNNKADAQALRDARPDRVEPYEIRVGVPLWNAPTKRAIPALPQIGSVTVSTP